MKRLAVGVGRSSDDLEECETSNNKRIKLLNNGADLPNEQVDSIEAKSLEMFQNHDSHSDHEDQSPMINGNFISKQSKDINHSLENNPSNNENRSVHDNNNALNHNHTDSKDEAAHVSSSDSSGESESHHSESQANSSTSEAPILDNKESKSDNTDYANHADMHNSDSTDSFQSENFETVNCVNILNSQVSKASSSQDNDDCQDMQSKVCSTLHKTVDIENLTLSHLEVTELEGHPDVIFCVAADEDFILSSSGDTTVKVWSMEDRSIVSNFSGHKDSVTSVVLLNQKQTNILKKKLSHPEVAKIAITGSVDCHIKVWSVTDGHEIASIYTFNGITCLGYLESESFVVIGTEGGKLELWDIASEKNIHSVRAHEDSVTDIKVEGSNIFSVSIDGSVKVWVFEEDEIYPVYTRKRKEPLQNKSGLGPAQWKTVAISNNVLYLGDHTNNLKVLDWRAGHLQLFKNQLKNTGVCESVITEKDMLLSTYYDSSSDTAGINVWRIPDMNYICTLTGDIQDICSLAIVQKENILRIVSGGHQLLVWDFDFSKAPSKENQDGFHVCELETLGTEINEKIADIKKMGSPNKVAVSDAASKDSPNTWCNVM